MVVDALVVHSADLEPRDAGILLEEASGVADDVLDEDRIVVSLHGDVALVGALEDRIHWRGGGSLGNANQFLDPDELPVAVGLLRADGQGHVAPLIVRSVITNLLGARAERGDGNNDAQQEVVGHTIGLRDERGAVFHRGGEPADRRGAENVIGKFDFDMRGLGVEAAFQFVKNLGNGPHRDLALMPAENFEEPAHVRPLEVMGQADGHGEARRGLLLLVLLIEDRDGERDVADADLINGDAAGVRSLLNVRQGCGGLIERAHALPSKYSAQALLVSQSRTLTMRTLVPMG